jgi:Peptidase A4 family
MRRTTTAIGAMVTTLMASAGVAGAKPSASPAAAAWRTGTVTRPATSFGSTGAATVSSVPAPQIPPAPPVGQTDTNAKPSPSWVPRIKQKRLAFANWSGYANASIPGNYFNYVSSQWIEPYYTCSSVLGKRGSATAQWIGIDGLPPDKALEQDGTTEGCDGHGRAYYGAFWETIPGPPHQYEVGRPGDHIQAAVKYLGNNEFQFYVLDQTDRQYINVTRPCDASSCPLDSDEAVSEWPGNQLASGITLTKFGRFPFYNFYATSYYAPSQRQYYGWFGSTSLYNTDLIYTTGPKKARHGRIPRHGTRVVMFPSQLLQGGREFYETWKYAY